MQQTTIRRPANRADWWIKFMENENDNHKGEAAIEDLGHEPTAEEQAQTKKMVEKGLAVFVPLNQAQAQMINGLVVLGVFGLNPSDVVTRFMDRALEDLSRNSREMVLAGINAYAAQVKAQSRIKLV